MFHRILKRLATTKYGKTGRKVLLAVLSAVAGLYARAWRFGSAPGVVSVVVPFYNVERYLDECLTSLRGQSYPWLQIVVVDDGSEDRSIEVARAHRRRDLRVRIVRQRNAGLSAARNTGATLANGEYLMFIDSDDVVMRTTVATAVSSLRQSRADFAVFGYQRIRGDKVIAAAEWIRRAHSRPQRNATIAQRPDIQVNAVAWSKVYRREFYRRANLSFPVGVLYEDQPVSSLAYAAAQSFDILPNVGINWRIREDTSSISQQTTSPANLTAQIDAGLASVDIMERHGWHEAAENRAIQVLDINLMFYSSALLVADEEFYAAFHDSLSRLWARTDEEHRRRLLDPRTRIICSLVLGYGRSDVLEFLASGRTDFNSNPIVWENGRPVLDMPVRTDPRYDLDAEVFDVHVEQMNLIGGVKSVRFEQNRLHIEGWAYLAGISPEGDDPAPKIWLAHDSGDLIEFDVERVTDPAIDEFAGHMFVDYRAGGFRASLDVSRLPRTGSGIVRARLTSHGITNEDALYRRGQPEGGRTAWTKIGGGRFAYAAAAGGRPLTIETDAGLRLARLEGLRAQAPGELKEARLEGDSLLVTVDAAGADTLALVGSRATVHPVSVTQKDGTLTARIPLHTTVWGREETALPSGKYAIRVVRDGRIVSADLWPGESYARVAPTDVLTRDHRVRLRVRQSGMRSIPSVELSAPLAHDERGRRQQERLRSESAALPAADPAFIVRSLYGEVANCNPKGIHEAIRREGLEVPVYWSVVDHSVPIPDGGVRVIERSALWHEKLRTCKYMLVNVHQLPWYRKTDPGQVIIETFHGYPYKLMGHDWWAFADFPAGQVAAFDARARDWDFVVSPASYSTALLDRAFVEPAGSDAEFLEIGYPRNDVLVREEGAVVRDTTRELLGISEDEKVVLYAPTFRDYLSADDMTAEFAALLDLEQLVAELPGVRILLRGHPFNVRSDKKLDVGDSVIDVSAYPDINDLILASDAAILDYSSLRFDYALTDKPMLFFVPDRDLYHRHRPGLLPYDETAPGPQLSETGEVIEAIRAIEAVGAEYAKARETFRTTYADLDDGYAGRRLLERLGLLTSTK
ncbi:bifunctional glycosyltransferase/CDP-glycerol:glycerophosphate glycerophosphotransferase [Microbacterium esteraromaticum]|uniref:bifunctional glycosyltransferase/CDP-glycerol:glycerophosphate glycerophosphotransferase n=1 Tax=Microbacterium esteraromaticum TaxID=57043 RepID=UPI001F49DFC4|nr:CDP-glycerol glycerophosphotransferase family protein [Microbacterium esteraromaticum]